MAVVGGGSGGGSVSTIRVAPKSSVFLQQWWLVNQRNGLAVGGVASSERGRERVFLSTVIAEREEANVLHTQDGIVIIFRGFINTSRSSQNGVSLEVCQHFLVGFPHDWKKYSRRSFGDSTASSIDNKKRECNNSEKRIPVENKASVERKASVESQTNGQSLIGMHDRTGPSGKNIIKPPKTPTSAYKRKASTQKIGLDANNSLSRRVTRSISKTSHTMPEEDEKDPIAKNIFPIADLISPVRRSPRLYSCK